MMKKLCFLFLLLLSSLTWAQYNFTSSVTSGCGPLDVSFNFNGNSNGVQDLYFELGDGEGLFGALNDPFEYTYTSIGTFNVMMYALDANGDVLGFSSGSITVTGAAASVSATEIGIGDAITGSVTGDINTVTWDFGDGNTSTDLAPTHVYATPGSYTITAYVNSASCGDQTYVFDITVSDINFTSTPAIACAPSDITFTYVGNNPSAAYLYWDYGDGTNDFTPILTTSTTHNFPVGGTYNVSLSVFDAGFQQLGFIDHEITIDGIGIYASLTATSVGQTIEFEATGVSGAVNWNFGDGTTGTNLVEQHDYATAGSYMVTLTGVSAICGQQTVTLPIEILDLEVTVTPTGFCTAPFTIDFATTGSMTADYYFWDFGDDSTDFGQNVSISHDYMEEGYYEGSLTLFNAQFQEIGTIYFDVLAGTTIEASNTIPAAGEQVEFYSFGDISSITWDFGDGSNTTTDLNPIHAYNGVGNYTVTAIIVSPTCGTVTKTIDITIYDISYTFNQLTACGTGDLTITFTGNEPSATLVYVSFGDGEEYFGPNGTINHTYASPGAFTVEVVAMNNQTDELGYNTYNVLVNTLPAVNAGSDDTLCFYNSVTLSGTGTATTYTWDNGVTDGVAFTATAPGTVLYTVTGIDANGCSASDQVEIVFDACAGLEENTQVNLRLYPNPSTGIVHVQAGAEARSLKMYSIQGQMIMEISQPDNKQLDLNGMSQGVYMVHLLDAAGNVLRAERLIKN